MSYTAEALRERLSALLGGAWSADWLKAVPKKPRVYQPRTTAKQAGAHTSVHKILEAARERKQALTPSHGSQ